VELLAVELLALSSSLLALLVVFAFRLLCRFPRGKVCHPSAFGHNPLKHQHQREQSHCGRTMGWGLSASALAQGPLCKGRRHP